jgi:hypothetical protein
MDEMKYGLSMLKTVKKTTYNEIINQTNRKIIPSNSPNKEKQIYRSKSNKNLNNFVPKLRPKKSTLVPTPLKLNNINKNCKLNKEKEQICKKYTNGQNHIIEESDSSYCSSSSMSSSSIDLSEDDEFKNEKKDLEDSFEIHDDNNIINDNKENKENENIKSLSKKKPFKLRKQKSKETEEFLPENCLNNCDIKEGEKEDNTIECEKKIDIRPKTKSIFEVISIMKKGIKK